MAVPPAEPTDETESQAGFWSGAAANPGSTLVPAYVIAAALLAIPALVVGVVLFALIPALPWWLGAPVGLALAVAAAWWRGSHADRYILATLGTTVDERHHPERLTNMVEGLTLAGGVIAPSIILVDDQARNASAIRRHDRNHLVFTTGLVEALEVVELEGTVAELLTRLRNGDAESATVGAALLGRPLADGPLGTVLGPLSRAGLGRILPADRDLEADRQAVALTRYPPGLLQALEAIQGHETKPGAATGGTAHLWLVDPVPTVLADGTELRAPLSLRIDALAEL